MIYLISIFVFVIGATVGSFLNVVILRVRNHKSFISGRSYCPKCKKQINWCDNVPILSFLFLKGKCRHCRTKISLQYPLIETATAILFVIVYMVNNNIQYPISNIQYFFLLRDWLFISILIIIFVYDLRWYLILDKITLPALGAVLVINIFLGFSFTDVLIGAIIGSGFFFVQFFISGGKWIGGGDIRLGALMGVMLGIKGVILALFLAYIIGSIVSIGLVALSIKKWKSQVPMGTFLVAGTIIVLLLGDKIWQFYRF